MVGGELALVWFAWSGMVNSCRLISTSPPSPTRSRERSPPVMAIRIGMRWATLVNSPAEISRGTRAKVAAEAGMTSCTTPLNFLSG